MDRKTSSEAAKHITESLDYVYIDGNHQYEYVLEDISKYYSLLKSGGTLVGHNFTGG